MTNEANDYEPPERDAEADIAEYFAGRPTIVVRVPFWAFPGEFLAYEILRERWTPRLTSFDVVRLGVLRGVRDIWGEWRTSKLGNARPAPNYDAAPLVND